MDLPEDVPEPFKSVVVEGLPDTPANVAWLLAHFQCEQCGQCCRVHTIGVRITKEEAARLAARANMSPEDFTAPLVEDRGTFFMPQPCRFMAGTRCGVHDIKPSVCRRYPFNKHETVDAKTAWVIIASCPGAQKLLKTLASGRQLGLEYRPFKKKR